MRTVITYLDKNKNRTTKENAWTIMTQVFNDAGNLQRTGYSIGEAQARAAKPKEGDARALRLRDAESGEVRSFTKNVVKVGRDEGCDIVCSKKEDKKRIDKVHASFELREGRWMVMDLSKTGVWINGTRIPANAPQPVKQGDVIDLGQRRKLELV